MKSINKLKYFLRRHPKIIERIRMSLGKESELMTFFQLLRKGSCFIDIGANCGQFTIPLSHYLGKEGEVHAFEPVEKSFVKMKNKFKTENPIAKTYLNNAGLAQKNENKEIFVPDDDYTQASLIKHANHSWKNTNKIKKEKIKLLKLDEYIENNITREIDLIKCDVEGAEFDVFKGAENLLRSKSPPILKVEIYKEWTNSYGYEPRDLINFLENISKYRCYYISPKGLIRIRSNDREIPGTFWKWLDFLFVTQEKEYKLNFLR